MRKITACILALLLLLSVTACKPEITHTHTYETTLSYDDTHHFYKATCEHVNVVSGKEEHDYDSNFKCKTCGYKHEHKYHTEYTGDNEYHWYPSICGHTEFVKDKQPHELNVELYCIHCDRKHRHTYNDYYTSDETYHWKDTTCGHPLAITVPEQHSYDENFNCIVCEFYCDHNFSTDYTYDSTYHWFASNCTHNDITKDKQEHVYNSNYECVCGFTHTHTYESTYTYDSEKHYKKSTCGHNVVEDESSHKYDITGYCVCGHFDASKIELPKTHLYVVTYDGGWGIEWLNTMAREFEAMYENYSFETGKQGVVVHVKGGKSDVTGDSVKSLMATSNYDVYFTTFNLRQYVLEDKLMDITDVVTNTMNADYKKVWSDLGETGSIADKMDSTIKGYVQYAGANAAGVVTNVRYYGIPMYSSFYNINYDIDLFYEQGLYLKEDGTFCAGTVTDRATEAEIDADKSLGQDGIKGTEDDGLPITYQDWVNMCNKMTRRNISPICWSGNLGSYRLGYFNQFWANYEGADDWYINVTGMGEDSEFGTITLEQRNGYLTSGQAGRKASLKFAEDIVRNNRWNTDASSGTDHYGAQDKFLQSKFYSERSESIKRIAMLIEGGWWENEAKTTIEYMANQYGGEYVNRRFGVMTFPRMDNGHYTETKYPDANGNYTLSAPANVGDQGRKVNDMVLVSVTPDSNVAIRKNAKQVEASKLFLAYTTTEKCLRTYTRMTGSTRCYDYDLTSEDKAQMSTYKQQLWGYYNRAIKAGNIRYISGPGKFGEYNPQIVSGNYGICYNGLSFGGATYSAGDPITLFQCYSSVTAEEYFNGYKNFFSANNGAQWKASFCKNL